MLRQKLLPGEIIIIDNNSSDDTVLKASSISSSLIKIIVNEENRGYNYSLAKGIEIAKGTYVAFLDSDDTWDESYLFHMINQFESANIQGDYSVVGNPNPGQYTNQEQSGDFLALLKKGNSYTNMSGTVARADVAKALSPYPALPPESEIQYKCQDDIFWFEMTRDYKFALCTKPLVERQWSSNSISKDLLEMAKGWEALYDKYAKTYLANNLGADLAKHYLKVSMKYLSQLDFSSFMRCIVKRRKLLREEEMNGFVSIQSLFWIFFGLLSLPFVYLFQNLNSPGKKTLKRIMKLILDK